MFLNSLSIILTEECNLACRYCYLTKKRYPRDLDEKTLKKALDIFFYFPPKDKSIMFSGGEPLLNFGLLKKAVIYLRKKEKNSASLINISLLTNGTLLDKNKIDFLSGCKVKTIISLDGPRATCDQNRIFADSHGESCFKKIMENLKQAQGKQFGASLVFGRTNFRQLPQNLNFLNSLKKFDQIDFYPQLYQVWTPAELKELKAVFGQIKRNYLALFNKKKPCFKISLLYSFLKQSYLFKRNACAKILLGADGNFYLACPAFFSIALLGREKYKVGDWRSGIDFQKRLKYLNKAEKAVSQIINFRSPKARLTQPFCFFNAFYYSCLNKKDHRKYLDNIREISEIYRNFFLSIKENLISNQKFRRLYSI